MAISNGPRSLARIGLACGLVALCGWPYLRWFAHPSLFDDDFLRVGSLRRSTLGEALFRPFNEHMAPLFETVSWLAWRGAGRQVLAMPMAFQVASFAAFGVTVTLLAALIRLELRSRTAALVGVAMFCLSAVSAETVLWYSASSFQWAASATLASWLAASMATAAMSFPGRLGWLVAAALAALTAPAFSAIGVLAGPLAALRVLAAVERPCSLVRRLGDSVVPALGTAIYLLICSQFRFHALVSASVHQNLAPWAAIWATLRAPAAVLIPGLFGLPDISASVPGIILAGSTLAGLTISTVWASRSRHRPVILCGLALIVGGYLSTYATRARPGDPWIFGIQRYHLFPQIGLVCLVAAAVSTRLRKLDADLGRSLLAAACVAACLAVPQYPRMQAASDRAFRYPDQSRALAAAVRLEEILGREGITVPQAMAALEPIRTRWFPRPWPFHPLLTLFADGPTVSEVPDHLVRTTLIAALSAEDRESLFGGMEATRYRIPARSWQGTKPPVEARLVSMHRIRSDGRGGFRSEGPPSHLEFEIGPGADDAGALVLPGMKVSRAVELWWAGRDGVWTPYRSARWNPDPDRPGEDWAVPLEMLPHWRRGEVGRLRVVLREWGPVAVGPPVFLR